VTPEEIAADLADNGRYLESEGREGAAAMWADEDLSGTDLRSAVLASAMLISARFDRCDLDGADLSRAEAGGARFDGASMVGADLTKAVLAGATFDRANLSSARLVKAELRRASFAGAKLVGAVLDRAHLSEASFRGADLAGASLMRAILVGADLRGADLAGARLDGALVDAALRLDGARGLDTASIASLNVRGQTLEGDAARTWVIAQQARRAFSVEELEQYLMAKMSSPRVGDAQTLRAATAEIGAVLDEPTHAAAEYRRILGAARGSSPVTATGAFQGSFEHVWTLPRWPDVELVVREDRNGNAWGVGFRGGPAELPSDLADIEPWRWTFAHLSAEATGVEKLDEWSYDLDAILTFGTRRFRARFDLGLLQSWMEI
jgi:uncharacterized protein YjbI with pentapeptide repeats